MYGGDDNIVDRGADEIDRLMGAIQVVRGREASHTPEVLRAELIRLRRAVDLLELEFSVVASAFADTDEREWQGSVSPIHWLRVECGMTAAAAWNAVCVGDQAPSLPLSTGALEGGKLGYSHLAVIAGTARALRESPSSAGFDEIPLLDQALAHDLKRFRDDCAHVRHAHDAEAFLAEQVLNAASRTLEVRTQEGGAVSVKGFLDPVGGAAVIAALDPLARRLGSDDDRTRDRRFADALVELATHGLDSAVLPKVGGQSPHLQITTTLETLAGRKGAPAGILENAGPVAAATVRRFGCDSSVTTMRMSKDSNVLNAGRARRLPGLAARRALRARDAGCVWPACDRPVSWTAAHHLVHWAQGGATDLKNLVLLCHRHHWLVHEGGWKLVRDAAGQIRSVAPIGDVVRRVRAPDPPPEV